jgi:hypothetical protein
MNDTEQFINNNITFIKNKIEINQLFELYDIIDYCIPMRYHACLFSIYTNTPFLPMYTTRKISNLLLDINWQHSYKLECNTIDIPITINYNELLIKFDNLVNAKIDTIYDFKSEYNIAIDNFNNIFLEKLAYKKLDDMHDKVSKFTLAMIYACRDNPFKGSGRSIGGGTRGLAPTTTATGQMVVFSAGSGQQALDKLGPTDKSKNGLFTRIFVEEMQQPGVTVDRVLRNVRSKVVGLAKSVGHNQVPAIYDQVVGEFYFRQ